MKKSDINKVVNIGSVTQVLGSIILEPTLLKENADEIIVEDFTNAFHKILFGAFSNLIADGVEVLDIPTVVNYISQYPAQKNCFESNNGVEYLERLQEITNVKNFEFNLKTLKKFSKLREIAKSGMDITDLFDPNETEPTIIEQKNKELTRMQVSDICDYFTNKILTACECKDNIYGTDYYDTAQSIDNTISSLGSCRLGLPLVNPVISTASKGCCSGKLVIESCGSGLGKSRKMIRECCHLAIPFIFNTDTNRWESTKMPPQSVLYINTELDREETDIIALAYLTSIDSEKIELNRLTKEERERVEYAGELMKKYPIHIVILPEYSINDMARLIDLYVAKYKVKQIFIDYLMENGRLLSEAQKNAGGVPLRGDQVLLQLGTMLKTKARQKKVFIYTATQVNGTASVGDGAENRGVAVVRGSKSLIDKVDLGIVTFRPTKTDLKKLEPIIQGFGYTLEVNYGYSLHKNRGSKLTSCYVFCNMNLGNVREVPIIVTDYNYNPLSVELIEVEFNDESNTGILDISEEDFYKRVEEHISEDEANNERLF